MGSQADLGRHRHRPLPRDLRGARQAGDRTDAGQGMDTRRPQRRARLKRDDFLRIVIPALASCVSMISSENRCTLFGIMLYALIPRSFAAVSPSIPARAASLSAD